METSIVFWFFGLLLPVFGVYCICTAKNSFDKFWGGIALVIFGAATSGFATFTGASVWMPSGLPMTSIENSTNKVAFVYIAGENVNVGVEKGGGKNERLYLYQFPKSAFDGKPNPEAKKLTVVESGGFRKLVLE